MLKRLASGLSEEKIVDNLEWSMDQCTDESYADESQTRQTEDY
jgi:hypothetical protein